MGIKIKNVDGNSFLGKFVKPIAIETDSSLTLGQAPVDLSNGYTDYFVVPVACRLTKHVWSHHADFTASTGLTVNIKAPIQSATMVNLVNVWSASELTNLPFSGSDWSANRPVTTKLGSSQLLTAGSPVVVNVSAVSGTKSIVSGYLEFTIEKNLEK